MSAAGGPEGRPGGLELRVGGRVWLDGQGWEVSELTGAAVRLTSGASARTVSVAALLDALHDPPAEELTDEGSTRWDIPSVVLAGLDQRQREKLNRTLGNLRRLLEPSDDDERSLGQRYEDLTGELGVTRRTLERQVARLTA